MTLATPSVAGLVAETCKGKLLCSPIKAVTLGGLLSRDSAVGIATGYGLNDRGIRVRVPIGSRIFSTSSRSALRSTQPPIQWVPGVLSPGLKLPGREADYSPPTSAEVKKIWIFISTPHRPSWRSA
jgi:hypothetical protein